MMKFFHHQIVLFINQKKNIFNFPNLAWIGIAAALIFAFLNLFNQKPLDQGVAKLIRLEGVEKPMEEGQVLQKDDEFAIEEGLVEMA